MAYTVIEVCRKTGISPRKLRFWIQKGLFDSVETDKNGVRFFNNQDIQWVIWVNCYRKIGLSIKEIKHYFSLCQQGKNSLEQRREILNQARQNLINELELMNKNLEKIDAKIKYYDDAITKNKDELNPLSKDYKF